ARPAVTADDLLELDIPWNLERIGAPNAWPHATGKGVIIAMIDSGICDTPALTGALWVHRGETQGGESPNGKDDDGNGYVDDLFGWDFANGNGYVIRDSSGHGSMCASIAAGRPASGAACGVAPGARLMILRGGGRLETYEYALANGADVISMSYMWVQRPLGNYRAVYRLAHEHLCAAGIVSVGGAGNFAKTAPTGKQIALPKDIPCVLAAAGILEDGSLAPQSSRGPVSWSDVRGYESAPTPQKPDVTACFGGYPVWAPSSTGRLRPGWKVLAKAGDGNRIIGPRGNSFSGPHVAGTAALVLEANPDLPAWRVNQIIRSTCHDLGAEGADVEYGAGLLRADKAVHAAIAARKAR
ncbi:MAG: S8 family serine peptidase, partial [Planctomycetes bacterium]|nr:S8 family serine peptidase [Planctomycetota bacterium]